MGGATGTKLTNQIEVLQLFFSVTKVSTNHKLPGLPNPTSCRPGFMKRLAVLSDFIFPAYLACCLLFSDEYYFQKSSILLFLLLYFCLAAVCQPACLKIFVEELACGVNVLIFLAN